MGRKSGFEQKIPMVGKFVWGWTGNVQEGKHSMKVSFEGGLLLRKTTEFVKLIHTDKGFQMKVG